MCFGKDGSAGCKQRARPSRQSGPSVREGHFFRLLKLCGSAGRNALHVSEPNGRQPIMVTSRADLRDSKSARRSLPKVWSHSTRILLVHPQKGCTGVLVLETGKPTAHIDPTPEDVE
jgi:hypothetical protein